MPRKGKDFEKLVQNLESILSLKGMVVQSPEIIVGQISGIKREIDITVRSQSDPNFLIIIECRDRATKSDVTWIEQVASKNQDVNAKKAIVVSSSGFSEGAKNLAQHFSIEICTFEEMTEKDTMQAFILPSISVFNCPLQIISVDIKARAKKEFPLTLPPFFDRKEDWRTQYSSLSFVKTDTEQPCNFYDLYNHYITNDILFKNFSPPVVEERKTFSFDFNVEPCAFKIFNPGCNVEITGMTIVLDLSATLHDLVPPSENFSAKVYKANGESIANIITGDIEIGDGKYIIDLVKPSQINELHLTFRDKQN